MPPIFAALMLLPIVINTLLVIHVLVSLLIVLLVLMQRPKNEGLGAAFGGGATDQLFGAQTTNVLQTLTRWLGFFFFALTLMLSILYVKKGAGRSALQEKLSAPTVIPATPVPATPDPAADATLPVDLEKELKLKLAPPLPGGVTNDPVQVPKVPEAPKSDAPAVPGTPPAAAPAAPPAPADAKPAEPAPAEPKPADPAPAEPAK